MALPPDPEEILRAFEPQSSAGRTWERYVSESPFLRKFGQRYGDDLSVSAAVHEISEASKEYLTYFDNDVQALEYLRSGQSKDYRTQEAGGRFRAISGRGGSGATSNVAAPITDIPTTTSNPERPRTVAAGWESYAARGISGGTDDVGVLTVVFRDGTYWNYYDIGIGEWSSFQRSRSKGWYILTFFQGKRHGEASVGTPAAAVAEIIYRIARTSQGIRGGGHTPGKHTPASYEVRKKLKQFNRYTKSAKQGRYLADPGYGRKAGRYVTSSKPIRQGQPPNQ
jgi:hypothetical protein